MHILIVEDERKMAALLRRVLTEERHSVDLAYDGPTGLDLALSDTYDVMILDLMLPGWHRGLPPGARPAYRHANLDAHRAQSR
jgi:DNA-binding response OmpR family regulator